MRWYRDAFCAEEKHIAAEQHIDPYTLLDKAAAGIPAGSYGMICSFSDIMNYINWKHAAPGFFNFELNAEKYNKFTFYRAIMENTALVTLGHVMLVEEATGNRPQKIVFAGGSSKSVLWSQILADILNIQVEVPVVKEATALGAAIMAGKGVGLYADVKDAARKLVRIERIFTPNKRNKEVYETAFEKWKTAYAAQLRLSDEKVTKYMWLAPGM